LGDAPLCRVRCDGLVDPGPLGPVWGRGRRLSAVIVFLFDQHHGNYGSPRINADLRDAPVGVHRHDGEVDGRAGPGSHATHGNAGSSTKRDMSARKTPDGLRRDFTPQQPDLRWCGDLTEIPTDEAELQLRRAWTCIRGAVSRPTVTPRSRGRRWRGSRCPWRLSRGQAVPLRPER
jgi:transposase InsO family protein